MNLMMAMGPEDKQINALFVVLRFQSNVNIDTFSTKLHVFRDKKENDERKRDIIRNPGRNEALCVNWEEFETLLSALFFSTWHKGNVCSVYFLMYEMFFFYCIAFRSYVYDARIFVLCRLAKLSNLWWSYCKSPFSK